MVAQQLAATATGLQLHLRGSLQAKVSVFAVEFGAEAGDVRLSLKHQHCPQLPRPQCFSQRHQRPFLVVLLQTDAAVIVQGWGTAAHHKTMQGSRPGLSQQTLRTPAMCSTCRLAGVELESGYVCATPYTVCDGAHDTASFCSPHS